MLTRAHVLAELRRTLEPDPLVRTVWLGGSDANARTDDLSDIDLMLIVEPGSIETVAARIEHTLETLSPISIRHRLPLPTWHGFHQAFYQLRDAPEHLMIDWVMMERDAPHPWLEVERHGSPLVLFDKDSLVKPTHVDRAARDEAIRRKVGELRVRFQLYRHLAPKCAARDLPVDAMHFYFSVVIRPLVDMLRIVHCPDRHDFGLRYLRDDLPPALYETVCRLSYPAGPEQIAPFTREASLLFADLLAAWDAQQSSS